MNDEEKVDQLSITEADTTPPNPAGAVPPPGGWQMPEPKFQQSSGYLPQGYLDQVNMSGSGTAAVAPAPAPAGMQEPAALPDVEPQPDLSEQLDTVEPAPVVKPAVAQRSNGARIVMVLLGILAMIAFLVVFLGAVYYLFLAPSGEGSQF